MNSLRRAIILTAFAFLSTIALDYITHAKAQQIGAIYCSQALQYDASTNGNTRIATSATGRTIYVCGFVFGAAAAVNVSLVYGTGTNCGTGTTQLTPAFQFTAAGFLSNPGDVYRGINVPNGQDLCVKTSAGVAVQALVNITQQ